MRLSTSTEILRQEETLLLSERDARAFLDALENPPTPAANLVQALQAHRVLVKC